MNGKLYLKQYDLSGKTAVVTGGLGILGQHFCRGLAECGAHVVVVDLDQERSGAFAQELAKEYGIQTLGISCDITDPSSVQKMVDQVVKQFHEIHILLNNAAGKSNDLDAFFAPFEDYTLDQWKQIMSVNVDGMFLVAQAIGKQMVQQGKGGSIIQTSSIYGIMGPDQRIYEGSYYLEREINSPAVYSASKAAVVGLTNYLATYWAEQNIRVNTITPGGVESGQNEQFKKKYSARIPLGRMAQPDELVGAILFLASDASSYITGHNLIVDGGLHAW
ncbi:SDR family oxidoreductase [Caldalkalibacillus mannanilyticus]|uniref:SDR family oxidoreductase n=1 Tax=Caldalkalibacillus mannanilyticus TaxID=1418 RepID=UPI000468E8E9|nr:SDR family oxidoreductase [Caldalkalibacillus mannanilyticus]